MNRVKKLHKLLTDVGYDVAEIRMANDRVSIEVVGELSSMRLANQMENVSRFNWVRVESLKNGNFMVIGEALQGVKTA